MKSFFLASCAALALTAFTPVLAADTPATDPAAVATPHYGAWGYDLTGEDPAASPGTDFFNFANGKWVQREQIPADRPRFGHFDKLAILSENRTRLIVEAAAAGRSDDPDAAKVGGAYRAFMDEARIQALDAKPLAGDLGRIKAEKTRTDIAALMGSAPRSFQSAVFAAGIQADAKAPTHYAVYMNTDGLGLPTRDYYLEPQFADKKKAYQAYVARMLTEIGWAQPEKNAAAIVAFETAIAKADWTLAEQRDRDKTYNPTTVAALNRFAPGFDFAAYLRGAGLASSSTSRVILADNTAFPKVAAIYAKTPIATLKAWQAFHVVDSAAPYLSDRFVQARFEFRNKTLAGQPQLRVRWKRGAGFVEDTLGESVGRLYVAQYFTPEAKAQMLTLVGNLKDALHARIENLTWMQPATKAKALQKLAKFTVKIGYPDTWRDYSPLVIKDDDLYGDATRSADYEWMRQVRRLNDPVDKMEWGMTPQTVNAYYNYANNEVVFPAAILQPPFFDPSADPAVNYGGIGAVIGHEMTHGFDDQGRKSDGDGLLTDWWTPADAEKFKIQAARLGAQYSAFEPLAGAHVKGDQTMGENIADMGGVLLALDAYHASLHGQPAPVIDGLTGDQRVFLGFAQVWRQKIREDALRQALTSDVHSPAHYRVVGTVRNVDAWYDAFGVKPGDPMYVAPDQRVRIW